MSAIIKRPLLTEKNSIHQSQGTFAFEVVKTATKTEIKAAVEKVFRVKVASVRTQICRDRTRRMGQNLSRVRQWKKALVRLAPGEKIQMFEGA